MRPAATSYGRYRFEEEALWNLFCFCYIADSVDNIGSEAGEPVAQGWCATDRKWQ